jgi:hypothetical protein
MYLSKYTDRDNPGGMYTQETGGYGMVSTRRMKFEFLMVGIGGISTQSMSREDSSFSGFVWPGSGEAL